MTGQAYDDFIAHVPVPDEKVILLYGYRLDQSNLGIMSTGDSAAETLLDACMRVSGRKQAVALQRPKYLRSYGNTARKTQNEVVAQDEGTAGALTEVLAARLPPLGSSTLEDWIENVNIEVQRHLEEKFETKMKEIRHHAKLNNQVVPFLTLFGRRLQPGKKFSAELDSTHRKVDYMLPAHFLGPPQETFKRYLPAYQFHENAESDNHDSLILDPFHPSERRAPSTGMPDEAVKYMQNLKRAMQRFTTHVIELDSKDTAAVNAKKDHIRKRQRQKQKFKDSDEAKTQKEMGKRAISADTETALDSLTGNVLKRKSFHNFTISMMAHDFLANRRLDRFFHKCTLHTEENVYLLLSLTGDIFLKGQILRVIGTWIAIQRGLVDEDILECLFDADYPALVPTPPAPSQGLYAQSVDYNSWEGKCNAGLTPRYSSRYSDGWNDQSVLRVVRKFGKKLRQSMVEEWESNIDGCSTWVRDVLEPWASNMRQHLFDYHQWKDSQAKPTAMVGQVASTALTPEEMTCVPRPSMSTSIADTPKVYKAVLYHLRYINESGQWPETSTKRQIVMVTEARQGVKTTSNEKPASMQNASGSFSIGYMPRLQPKANSLFPEFVKAAFALERVLCPNRPPSSTIAVNRNAQFRP